MVKVHFQDSGMVWAYPDSVRHLTKKELDNIFSLLRWYRNSFSENASVFSYAVVKVDGYPRMLLGLTEFYSVVTEYRKGEFIDHRRCYHA